MLALYQSLLRLYPAPYRQQFAAEMLAVFRDVGADAHEKEASPLPNSTFAKSPACFAEPSPNTLAASSATTSSSQSHPGGSPCVPISVSPR